MDTDEQTTISEVTRRLRERFPTVGAGEVTKVVEDSYHSLDRAPIRSFVGILVEKQARESLESAPPAQCAQ